MADFKTAVQKTLVHEGGYVNNPHDKGGPTKYGITQADMPGVDISGITPDQAIEYYREHYWKPLYSQINDQLIAEKLFDLGVLFGTKVAVKILQITVAKDMSIVSDGEFGPTTLSDLNQEGPDLLSRYKTAFIQHCINIVNNNPVDGEFVHGWINRINS
jgi:lysozyme family protein